MKSITNNSMYLNTTSVRKIFQAVALKVHKFIFSVTLNTYNKNITNVTIFLQDKAYQISQANCL